MIDLQAMRDLAKLQETETQNAATYSYDGVSFVTRHKLASNPDDPGIPPPPMEPTDFVLAEGPPVRIRILQDQSPPIPSTNALTIDPADVVPDA